MVMLMSVNNIFLPGIDKESCFECGSNEELHFHHVIPKSRGGTRTVPLCLECHGKAHNKKMASGKLIKEGMARHRQEGRALGRPDLIRYGYANEDGKLVPRPDEMAVINQAVKLRKLGYSYRQVADELNETGRRNRIGNPFSKQLVRNIFVQRAKDKKTIDIERQDGYAYVSQ